MDIKTKAQHIVFFLRQPWVTAPEGVLFINNNDETITVHIAETLVICTDMRGRVKVPLPAYGGYATHHKVFDRLLTNLNDQEKAYKERRATQELRKFEKMDAISKTWV